ncbi:MAG: bifunctional DNA-formamidopyrimidine glycosylase/DNA-(apurinic or apyrimidinic site) lyase [Hyphomicrobiales bacterium]|nr:bifunctional DNA-formamidopyrimidine glycosylase/DNA-(apurinic or apyrimidinic site) lyase [Hyphomicrobiales bacterium]
MPELPEVETVKRGLAPAMEGARFTKIILNRLNLRFPFPDDFATRLENSQIKEVGRRAKYLTLYLDSDDVLIMHLGMSGSFHVEQMIGGKSVEKNKHRDRDRIPAHDHVVFHLENKEKQFHVIYNDPRRFGFMDLVNFNQLGNHKYFVNLGIEPTGNSLDGTCISQLFAGRKAPLKAAMLDQKLIAGLGNIYVCEALWQAGLSPIRQAKSIAVNSKIARSRAEVLADAIRDVIANAIAAGGSSLSDHRKTDGTLGYFQHSFNVYDREGETCNKEQCSGQIKRIVQSGRSTYYCSICQR